MPNLSPSPLTQIEDALSHASRQAAYWAERCAELATAYAEALEADQ
jgi:hypothetical protein